MKSIDRFSETSGSNIKVNYTYIEWKPDIKIILNDFNKLAVKLASPVANIQLGMSYIK